LKFLRSILFAAFVSLLVVTGYGVGLLDNCCHHLEVSQAGCDSSAPDQKAPGQTNDCHCLCHEILSPVTTEPVRATGALLVLLDFVTHADEYPPDAVPRGIDYPPQLA
jgi:hypothetical protein